MSSQAFGLSIDERRRLLEANAAAAQFFRRELLRATDGWPLEYLKVHGVESVLSADSTWPVGYAPRTWSNLVDQLHKQGFGYGTLARAGLLDWNEHGDAVDRHRDKLMLVAHDRRSSAVGFVGIGPDGVVSSSPVTAIHRPTSALIGTVEQRDLLAGGAVPVIVDEPVDAIAISKASLRTGGRWAGIPVCGRGLSTAQASMLRQFSTSDKVVVVLAGSETERNQSAAYLLDLAFFFDRVWAVGLPPGESLAGMAKRERGEVRVNDLLMQSRPLMTYRSSGRGFLALQSADLDPPGRGPGL